MKELYTHPQEIWDYAECLKRSRRRGTDGMGTPHPYPGLIAGSATSYPAYGQTRRYNGGRLINGELFQAEFRPLPIIHSDFEFIERSSWGTYIQRKMVVKAWNRRTENRPVA